MTTERNRTEIIRDMIARRQAAAWLEKARPYQSGIKSLSPNKGEWAKTLDAMGSQHDPNATSREDFVEATSNHPFEVEIDLETLETTPIKVRVLADRSGNFVAELPKRVKGQAAEATLAPDFSPIKSAKSPDGVLMIGDKQIKINIGKHHGPVWKFMVESLGWSHASIVYTIVRKRLYRAGIGCTQTQEAAFSDVSNGVKAWRNRTGIKPGTAGGAIRIYAQQLWQSWAKVQARQTKPVNPYTKVRLNTEGYNVRIPSASTLGYERKGTTARFEWRDVERVFDALQLTDTEQAILNMTSRGMTMAGIADHLQMPEGTVKSHLHRIRSRKVAEKVKDDLLGGLDRHDGAEIVAAT